MANSVINFNGLRRVEHSSSRRPYAIRISLSVAAIVCLMSSTAVLSALRRIPDIDLNGTGHSPAYDQPTARPSEPPRPRSNLGRDG